MSDLGHSSVNTMRVRFRSFDSWFRANSVLFAELCAEFPRSSEAHIERVMLRIYRNSIRSDAEKVKAWLSSCAPGGAAIQTRKISRKEANRL